MAGNLIPGMMAKPAPTPTPADDMPTDMSGIYRKTMGVSNPHSLPSQSPDQGYLQRLIGFIKSLMGNR